MDLLDSSLKAAVSFNSSSSPNKPAFEIYQDEALHDKILDQLHSKQMVTVKMASTTREYDSYDEPKLSLRFISDSMKLHSQFSKVPPGTLEIVKIPNTYKPQPENCYMEVLKVAKVTGDLCIRLVGQYIDVINVSIEVT